jgi:hypothetical protein
MKIVKKKLHISLENTTITATYDPMLDKQIYKYNVTLLSDKCYININSIECFIESEEPETFKEFKDKNNINSKNLVSWLNKNYK